MNLKKTDKIIAAVGIIILIVAVVAILLYIETDDSDNGNGDEPIKDAYNVYWTKETKKMEITGYAGKTPYTDPIELSVESGCVLSNAEFTLVFTDDITHGKLLNKGGDTLTAEVSFEGGEPQRISRSGGANATIGEPFGIYDMPDSETIEDVEDMLEVEEIIRGKYITMNNANFDVKVTWKKGEKLFPPRPIKLLNYIRDKGNGFKILVSYSYYKPEFESINNPNGEGDDENPPLGSGAIGEFFRDTSRGRDI
jgi:hypothetical protein